MILGWLGSLSPTWTDSCRYFEKTAYWRIKVFRPAETYQAAETGKNSYLFENQAKL